MPAFVTQSSGQLKGTCSPASCKAERETELRESRRMPARLLDTFVSFHLFTLTLDHSPFVQLKTVSISSERRRTLQKSFDFPFCVQNSLGTASLKLGHRKIWSSLCMLMQPVPVSKNLSVHLSSIASELRNIAKTVLYFLLKEKKDMP